MDAQLLGAVTAFGLAASTGLNTTLPLLIVGLLARVGAIDLAAPYDALSSYSVMAGLSGLAALEFVGDKVPALDSAVHAVQWPAAAAAGAILFASQSGAVTWVSPELAIIIGVLTSGGVHSLRMAARPLVTVSTLGMGNTAVSATEDAGAVTLAGTAVLAPVIALVLLVALLALLWLAAVWVLRRAPRRRRRPLRP